MNLITELFIFLVLGLSTIALLNIMLYYLIPFKDISLDPSLRECQSTMAYSGTKTIVGCATPYKEGWVIFPSFLFSIHEYIHVLGYGETEAYSADYILLVLFIGCFAVLWHMIARTFPSFELRFT